MRKLITIAAIAFSLVLAGATQAGIFVPEKSTLQLPLGGLPNTVVTGTSGTSGLVTLSDDGFGGHILTDQASIWQTTSNSPGSSFFTGVPFITNLKVTVHNGPGSFASSFSFVNPVARTSLGGPITIHGLGGYESLTGGVILNILGVFQITAPLTPIGVSTGNTSMIPVGAAFNITNTYGPWVTATVKITGVTSNIITVPARGGVQGLGFELLLTPGEAAGANTLTTGGALVTQCGSGCNPQQATMATLVGTNSLASASQPGMVTLVSPIRVDSGQVAGPIPAGAIKKFVFVPEPGTMLLLAAGAVGLVVAGRKRMRK